jgi:translation initiation factor IF-1
MDNQNNQENKQVPSVVGTVSGAMPNTLFNVILENGDVVLSKISGKMRMHRIRVLIGDKVRLEIDPYSGRGRIIKRL